MWAQAPGYCHERDVQRVELRLRGTGLVLMDADTGEIIDLRDPATLANAEALAAVWAYQTDRRRWIVPGSITRKRRASTDPRWRAIQAAVSCPRPRLRQLRESQQRTFAQARDTALAQLWRLLRQLAAMHGIAVDRAGCASWLRLVAVMLAGYLGDRRVESPTRRTNSSSTMSRSRSAQSFARAT